MSELKLDFLRTFVAVYDTGSYAAAGQRVHRSQGAVTQQMQRLQEQVSVPLFEKHGRSNQLTPQGEVLLDYARRLLSINDEAFRRLHDRTLSGSLRIGAPHDVAENLLSPLLATIARSSPMLNLDIDVGRSPFLMEALKRGDLDLTISTRVDVELEGVVLRTSPTVWICSADYAHDRDRPIPLILADERSLYRAIGLEALNRSEVPWRLAYVAQNLIGIKSALRARLGVTARSIELLSPEMRVLGEKDGLPDLPDVSYYLWMRKDAVNSVTHKVFQTIKNDLRLYSF